MSCKDNYKIFIFFKRMMIKILTRQVPRIEFANVENFRNDGSRKRAGEDLTN